MNMDEQFDRIDTSIKEQGRLFESLFRSLETEMGHRFDLVDGRLDRIDATLVEHGKQIGAGARAIAGFNEWVGKADADYTRVLAELSELKRRVDKLEKPAA